MFVAHLSKTGNCIGVTTQKSVGENQVVVDSLDYAGLTYDWDTQEWSGTAEPDLITYRLQLTLREFILMFTPQELRLIKAKINTDDDILYFWEIAKADSTIDLEDPVSIVGMAKLVERKVLGQERHDEILQGILIEQE